MIKYQLINKMTGQTVGTYATRKAARNAADKKDNAYGAYVHIIREIAA